MDNPVSEIKYYLGATYNDLCMAKEALSQDNTNHHWMTAITRLNFALKSIEKVQNVIQVVIQDEELLEFLLSPLCPNKECTYWPECDWNYADCRFNPANDKDGINTT